MNYKTGLIKCGHNNKRHENCFARTTNGECICLTDCNFYGEDCHFYKAKKVKKEVKKHE